MPSKPAAKSDEVGRQLDELIKTAGGSAEGPVKGLSGAPQPDTPVATAPQISAQVDRELQDQLKQLLEQAHAAENGEAATSPGGAAEGPDATTSEPQLRETIDPKRDALLVAQLDQMLAAAAQEAIDKDFEGADVMPAPSAAPQPGESAAAAAAAVAEEAGAPDDRESAKPTSAGQAPGAKPTAVKPTGASADAGAAMGAPQRVPGAKAFSATKQDVARELAAEASQQAGGTTGESAGASAQPAEGGNTSASEGAGDLTASAGPGGGLGRELLFSVCSKLNWPVRRLSPQMRATVGYVALLTLFNGLVMTLWGLAKLFH